MRWSSLLVSSTIWNLMLIIILISHYDLRRRQLSFYNFHQTNFAYVCKQSIVYAYKLMRIRIKYSVYTSALSICITSLLNSIANFNLENATIIIHRNNNINSDNDHNNSNWMSPKNHSQAMYALYSSICLCIYTKFYRIW